VCDEGTPVTLTPIQRTAMIKNAERQLEPAETVLDVTFGALHVPDRSRRDKTRARATSVLATDRRVIFFRKRWGGYHLRALPYDQIQSVDHSRGRKVGELHIFVIGRDPVRVSAVPQDDVERLARLLRDRNSSPHPGDAGH
jgi:Bacterial PH domain